MNDKIKFLSAAVVAAGIFTMNSGVFAQDEAAADESGDEIATDAAAIKSFGKMVATQTAGQMKFTEAELKQFLEGFQEGAKGAELTEEEGQAMDTYLRGRMEQLQELAAKEAGKKNAKFFEDLKKDPDVKVSDSGLHYKIVREGEGPKPTAASSVSVHYEGTLIDGTKFDSSYDRGAPATFGVGGVVKGFGEGLQLIGVGGEAMLYIPTELGYGMNPRPGGPIKPGDALIFKIELKGIQ